MTTSQENSIELEKRYQQQVSDAKVAGRDYALSALETAAGASCACKALPAAELQRLANSDTATGATYYQQIQGNSRIPDGNEWDQLRRIADAALFRSFGDKIHFAALSTSGRWLANYGDGAVFFKDEMIGHRATVFEENTAVWVNKAKGDLNVPLGYRTTWDCRSKLVVAKLGQKVISGADDFDQLLLNSGVDSAKDSFVEVHIYGGFTFRSIGTLVVKSGMLGDFATECVKERAKVIGVTFLEVS